MGSAGRKDACCPSAGGPRKGPALSRGGQKACRGGGSRLCGRVKPQMFSHHTQGCDSVAQPVNPDTQMLFFFFYFGGTQGEAFGHISAVEIPTIFPRSLLLLPSLCFFLCLS